MSDDTPVWICLACGQWGRDRFGDHRFPDDAIDSARVCTIDPAPVPLGPLLRHHAEAAERERNDLREDLKHAERACGEWQRRHDELKARRAGAWAGPRDGSTG